MKEEKQMQISLDEKEFAKVEDLISAFCKKHRVYDEYFGVISRAVDIILNIISQQNKGYTENLELKYDYDGKSLDFEIKGKSSLNLMFDLNSKEKEQETLKLLASDIEFIDTNHLRISFMLNAIHQQEWVRRNSLMHDYYYRTRKHV